MNIWHTSKPTSEDFPIWAFSTKNKEVVFIPSADLYSTCVMTWCRAQVPVPPKPRDPAEEKFWVLRRSEATTGWLPSDWFKAGYQYGTHCKGTCSCDKGQRLKDARAPFVDPEEYFASGTGEPLESAFDERL